ncbi:MAG: transposase [Acidimicrobiaceae bacterium]|nr:transposase [Acidimicrobiaceae bacterium]
MRQRKSAANTLAALKSIRARGDDGEWINVIFDNLPAHKGRAVRKWAENNKVELCFTPTHSSWANPIEAHFKPLREFVLNNSPHPNRRPVGCTPTCAGATPTPGTPTRSPRNAANAPEPEPRKATAGSDHTHKQHETPQKQHARKRLWTPR